MSADEPGKTELTPRRPRRHWVLAGLGVLLLIMILFHGPILRWTVDYGAQWYAKKSGMKLEWDLSGSVVSDFAVAKVKVSGPIANGITGEITSDRVAASYNLWKLLRGETGAFLDKIELADTDVSLDLRHPGPGTENSASKEGGIPDVWVKAIHLKNINLRLQTPGGDLVMRGFTLMMDEGRAGEIMLTELILPGSERQFSNVRGKTLMGDHELEITELVLQPDVVVSRVKVDLRQITAGAAVAELAARIGKAALTAKAAVKGLEGSPDLDAQVTLLRFGAEELSRWMPMPEGMAGFVDSLVVSFKGPVAEPAKIEAQITAKASDLKTKGFNVENLELAAQMAEGLVKLQVLRLQSGTNTLEATGQAVVEGSWREVGRSAGEAQFKIHAPGLQGMVPMIAGPEGQLEGEGSVTFKDGRLVTGELQAQGKSLRAGNLGIAAVNAEVTTDAKELVVKSLAIQLDDKNAASVTGRMSVDAAQSAELQWQANLQDVGAVLARAGLGSVSLKGGQATSTGTMKFIPAEVKGGDLSKATAQAKVKVTKLGWKSHELQSTEVEAALQGNKVEIGRCLVMLDEQNRLEATGSMGLGQGRPVALKWTLGLTDLAAVWRWADVEGAAEPEAGTLMGSGTAEALLADLQRKQFNKVAADASLRLEGVKVKDAVVESLSAEGGLRAGRAELRALELRVNAANLVKVSGHLMLDEKRGFAAVADATLDQLADLGPWLALAGVPKLMEGKAALNWRGEGALVDRSINGGGTVRVEGARLETMPDPATLEAEVRHQGRTAEIVKLVATSGRFRAEGTALASDTELRVPRFAVFSDTLPLVDVTANVPLALGRVPRPAIPLDESRPVEIRVHAAEVEFERLFDLMGRKPPLRGRGALDVSVTGMLSDLEATAVVDVTQVKLPGEDRLEAASLHLDANLTDHRVEVNVSAVQPPLKPLVAKATMPLKVDEVIARPAVVLDAPLDARVRLENCDLALLKKFVPIVTDVRGNVNLDVQISGPVRAPQWKGALSADVPLVLIDSRYAGSAKDAKARLLFEGQKITVQEISANVAGGNAKVTGTVDLTELQNPGFDLQVNAADALIIRDAAMTLRANSAVKITGKLAKADVSGRVELVRGRVLKEIEFLPLSLPNQLPPPPPPAKVNKRSVALPAPMDQWSFNVDVVSGDPIRLLGNVLNGGTVVKLHAGGNGGAPRLEGKVTLEGAKLTLPFSRLDITRGDILFSGDNPFEPELDIQGDGIISNYQVSLFITGSAFNPKTRFVSSPPLPEADIATLVATGTTASDAGSAEGVAANRAAFLVLSQLYRKAFRKPLLKRNNDEPPRLTLSLSLFDTKATSRNVSAIYQISPKLQAVGAVGERGTFRGLLYYLIRFR